MNIKKLKEKCLSIICATGLLFSINTTSSNAIDTNVPVGEEFYIVSELNENKVVDLNRTNGNVSLWDNTRSSYQRWRFEYDKNRHAYKIISVDNGKALSWLSNKNKNVVGWTSQNFDDQYWIFDEISDNSYVIKNYRNKNMVLDVNKSGTSNGTNIGVYERHDRNSQRFKIFKEVAGNSKISLPKTVGFLSGLGQTIVKTQNINKVGFQQYWHSRNNIYTDTFTGYVSNVDSNSFEVRTGFFNLNGKLYHSDPETGESSMGYKTIGGETYFFNPDVNNPYYIENPTLSDIQKAKALELK